MLLQYEDDLADQICQKGVQDDSNTNLWACLGRLVSYKDNSPLPRQTLAANAGIFFAAGYETTAHAITWALFELAADPSMQVGVECRPGAVVWGRGGGEGGGGTCVMSGK